MNRNHTTVLICLILTIAVLAAFWDVKDHGFVNFDDDFYVYGNPHVRAGLNSEGVAWAFSTLHEGFWMPLTWLSHMLDCTLYGLNPKGHHLNDLLLHIANTLLLFLVLRKMTGALWRSAFVAALFALHPLHVETVAWITERKDVLSAFFWILTMWAYANYTAKPGYRRYTLVLIFYALGLMAKPMLMTLPFALLLLDYWPLRRLGSTKTIASYDSQTSKASNGDIRTFSGIDLIWEKVPLIILSAGVGFLTFFAERGVGALPSFDSFPLDVRVANALVSYVSYIIKMIWPLHLTVFYPHPGMPPWWQIAGALFLLGIISFWIMKRARRHPYLPVGWLWYLGTLVPVIGLIQIGGHSMADRYTYIPLVGLFIIMAWGGAFILNKIPHKGIISSVLALLWLLFLFTNTRIQVRHWQDSITLFTHALAVTPDNYLAHNNLAYALERKGEVEEAIRHIKEAIRIKPYDLEPHYNLGALLARQGNLEEAIKEFLWVLERDPNSAGANYNLGLALTQLARYEEAIPYFVKALKAKPDYVEARRHLQYAMKKLESSKEKK